jgi:hypothetical protein
MFARRPVKPESNQRAGAESTYRAVAQRSLHQGMLMWQMPVLSRTAQAFLLTIALGEGSSGLACDFMALAVGQRLRSEDLTATACERRGSSTPQSR